MTNSPVRRSKLNTVDVNKVHSNVGQEVIEITSDKLRLILNEHLQAMASRTSWQAPFGILVTIIVVLCTSEFKLVYGVTKDTWSAIFIISGLLSFGWLIKTLFCMAKAKTVDDILNEAKNEN